MRTSRCWIEIVALGTAIAFAVALLIATLGAAAAAFAQTTDSTATPTSYEGMVTCSRCGAKHSAKLGKTATDCTLACVHSGGSFALVDGDKTYQLDGDLAVLKKIAGQRARIMGVAHGSTIKVESVGPAM